MAQESPLVVANPDLDQQIRFMFEVPGAATRGKMIVPMFWKYGVTETNADVSITRAEAEKRNRALQRRLLEEEQSLLRYEETLRREEEEFRASITEKRALYREKEKELELLNEKAALEKRAGLLEKEEELKRAERENALLEAELDNQKRLTELRLSHDAAAEEILTELFDAETALAKESARSAELTDALERVKSEFLDKNRLAIREKQANEKRVFEAFDPRNILEIKEVYLLNLTRERYVLHLPTMSVRKGKVTVMTADDPELLSLAFKTVFRTYGAHLSMRSGEVRIDGVPTTSELKQDFKKAFGKYAVSAENFSDAAAHAKKSAVKTFAAGKNEAEFRRAVETLGGSGEWIKRPLPKLSDAERETVAAAAALLSPEPLTAFLEPFRTDDPAYNAGFLALLESRPQGKAYLILTRARDLVLKLNDFALYRLE